MQRILLRYQRETSTSKMSYNEIRELFLGAIKQAALPVAMECRIIKFGPALPFGATSEAEIALLELVDPRDPSEVSRVINLYLPPGLCILNAWIPGIGSLEENPAALDEAVYDIVWQQSDLTTEDVQRRLQTFLSASELPFTRVREKKTQIIDARALVSEAILLAPHDGSVHMRLAVSVGPKGTLRPDEFFQVLGYSPEPGAIRTLRIALLHSAWRSTLPSRYQRWRFIADEY